MTTQKSIISSTENSGSRWHDFLAPVSNNFIKTYAQCYIIAPQLKNLFYEAVQFQLKNALSLPIWILLKEINSAITNVKTKKRKQTKKKAIMEVQHMASIHNHPVNASIVSSFISMVQVNVVCKNSCHNSHGSGFHLRSQMAQQFLPKVKNSTLLINTYMRKMIIKTVYKEDVKEILSTDVRSKWTTRIHEEELFNLFTADIMKMKTKFTR